MPHRRQVNTLPCTHCAVQPIRFLIGADTLLSFLIRCRSDSLHLYALASRYHVPCMISFKHLRDARASSSRCEGWAGICPALYFKARNDNEKGTANYLQMLSEDAPHAGLLETQGALPNCRVPYSYPLAPCTARQVCQETLDA